MFIIKTPTGYLGKLRHSYTKGTWANPSAKREFARVYTRKGDAENACRGHDGFEIVPITLVEAIDDRAV